LLSQDSRGKLAYPPKVVRRTSVQPTFGRGVQQRAAARVLSLAR
jgi:hypothetical protein